MIKEEKEIEINEENIVIIVLLWSLFKEEGRKEKETECLIYSSVKAFEWLGRIEEEKEGDINEKEIELIKEEDEIEKDQKASVNRKEMIIYQIIFIISNNNWRYSEEFKKKIKNNRKVSKLLLEIVKNHLNNERSLIEKGNKKRIIEYIIYSYIKDINTSDLIYPSSTSYPFSHFSIKNILDNINEIFIDENKKELIKEEIFNDMIELFNNSIDIINIINECDIKKEREREIILDGDNNNNNNNIINNVYKKISFNLFNVKNIFSSNLQTSDLSLFDNENKNIIKRIISIYFNHNNNNIYNIEKEIKKIILMKPFLIDEKNRVDFLKFLTSSFISCNNFLIKTVYYLSNNSEEGCSIINILTKELTGEIVDRIKEREGNNNNNNNNNNIIIKERRRYERERTDNVYDIILSLLDNMMEHTFIVENTVFLGIGKEVKEDKDYISDIIEEEDMRECLILYLKHNKEEYIYNRNHNNNNNYVLLLSDISKRSNNALYYLLFVNKLKEKM